MRWPGNFRVFKESTIELVSARISRFKNKGTSDALINPVQPRDDKIAKGVFVNSSKMEMKVRVSAIFLFSPAVQEILVKKILEMGLKGKFSHGLFNDSPV